LVFLRITRWDSAIAYVDWPDYYRSSITQHLSRLTGFDKLSVKRLARKIRDRECVTIPMKEAVDEFDAETLRGLLQGVGAEVVTESVKKVAE